MMFLMYIDSTFSFSNVYMVSRVSVIIVLYHSKAKYIYD